MLRLFATISALTTVALLACSGAPAAPSQSAATQPSIAPQPPPAAAAPTADRVSSVTPAVSPAAPPTAPTSPAGPRQIITTLESRHGRLRIYTDSTFEVLDTAGKVLASRLTEAQLERRFPELHHAYDEGVASRNLDASLDPVHADPGTAMEQP